MNEPYFRWKLDIIKETVSLGASTLARQGAGSAMVILLNQSLYFYGGSVAVAVYGVLHRIISVLFVPVIGMTQGFLPIAGYNFGAKQFDRVLEAIYKSIGFGTLISGVLAVLVWFFPQPLILLFTDDQTILELGTQGLKTISILMPLAVSQSIAAGYFQAIGRPMTAFFMTISRQVLILIPMLHLLPKFFELKGIWLAFPVSDALAFIITVVALAIELPRLKDAHRRTELKPA